MKVRNAIKKVAAIGLGASMLGATVMGAVAADLGDYPNPLLIQDGVFEGVIVLGDNAVSSDTLGAIDIATGLQFSSTTATDASGEVLSVANGAAIASAGNDLNIDEDLEDANSKLDGVDLPDILGDGEFDESEGANDNTEDFTQELRFVNGSGIFQFDENDNRNDEAGLYLVFDDNDVIYEYELEFEDEVKYDTTDVSEDFETAKIDIQGNTYTFTDVKLDNSGDIDEITLQAGDTTVWLEQDAPITRILGGEEHEVELVDVSETEEKCGILVDGTLEWLDVGSSENINGVEVGVTEAIAVHSETQLTDVCEVNLGSMEIILDNSGTTDGVEVNGFEIQDSDVTISSDAGDFTGIEIELSAEDDMFLMPGDTWVDPVFGNFEINFASIVHRDPTTVEFDAAGDNMDIKFNNIDGREIVLPFACSVASGDDCDTTGSDSLHFGTDDDENEQYYLEGTTCTGDEGNATDCIGARFLVYEGDELHVLEIDDIDFDELDVSLSDITYGGTKTDDFTNDETADTLDAPGGLNTVDLKINGTAVEFTATGIGSGDAFEIENEFGMTILFDNDGTDLTNNTIQDLYVYLDETQGDTDEDLVEVVSVLEITFDSHSDDDLVVKSVAFDVGGDAENSPASVSDDDNDNEIGYTTYGTMYTQDTEDNDKVTVTYSADELYANVFVSPAGADVKRAAVGAVNVQKISVGTAKLASEVGSFESQNTLVVGGPCANAKAAEFLGVTADNCLEGAPEENTAVIQLKEMGDSVAILVNGYGAMDTRRAARVLANYDDYTLSGEEVVVTGTDFSNIQVSTV